MRTLRIRRRHVGRVAALRMQQRSTAAIRWALRARCSRTARIQSAARFSRTTRAAACHRVPRKPSVPTQRRARRTCANPRRVRQVVPSAAAAATSWFRNVPTVTSSSWRALRFASARQAETVRVSFPQPSAARKRPILSPACKSRRFSSRTRTFRTLGGIPGGSECRVRFCTSTCHGSRAGAHVLASADGARVRMPMWT